VNHRAEHIKQILQLTKACWDGPEAKPSVRTNFRRVLACRTPTLGAEVFASDREERIVPHTCKSKACPSCGNRGTLDWQRTRWQDLPDIPFLGITFTMPNHLWPIFKAHPALQHDLPALGAAAIERWAWSRYKVRLYVLVVQHTFGSRLNYHPHLHIMVSAGGLRHGTEWLPTIEFHQEEVMTLWRYAVTDYLEKAYKRGLLMIESTPNRFSDLLDWQRRRRWNIHLSSTMNKRHFLGYAGRYIRRLPIAQRRIMSVTEEAVIFTAKNKRLGRDELISLTPEAFVHQLGQHIQDRYRHSMRYFGLLAPRTQHLAKFSVFIALNQQIRPKARRLAWREALKKYFNKDPLLDSQGNQMRWSRRIGPR
jgi:hypothetical protein